MSIVLFPSWTMKCPVMEEMSRLVSTGDCVRIWDAGSMAPLEQFNPHSTGHPVAQAFWGSNSILMDQEQNRPCVCRQSIV